MTQSIKPSDEEVEAICRAINAAVMGLRPRPKELAVCFAMVRIFGAAAIDAGFTPVEFDGAMEAFKKDFRRNYEVLTQ